MPGDLKVGIRLTADGKGFVGEVRVAKRELDKLAGGTGRADRAATKFSRSARRAEIQTRRFGAAAEGARSKVAGYIGAIAGAAGIAAATRGLARHADAYTRVTNAVRIATDSTAAAARVQGQLFDIAQRTRSPIEAIADLYQKLSISQADLGASGEEMLQVIEGVGQSLALSGRSATQSAGALLQLSQALANGKVQAEEFNSIIDGAPALLHAVAQHIDGAGGSFGKFRQLVRNGQVTSRQFFNAIKAALPGLASDFQKTTATIDQGFVAVNNAMTEFVGRMDQSVGASSAVSAALENFAGALDNVNVEQFAAALQPVLYVLGAIATVLAGRALVALAGWTGGVLKATAATATLAARTAAAGASMTAAGAAAGRMGRVMRGAGIAARGLGIAVGLATGPVGWAVLAATAVGGFLLAARDTKKELEEFQRVLDESDSSKLTAESTAAAVALARERVELAKLNLERSRATAAEAAAPTGPTAPLRNAYAALGRLMNPGHDVAAAHADAVSQEMARLQSAEDDLERALQRQNEVAAAPAPGAAAAAAAAAAAKKEQDDAAFRQLQRRLSTEREAIDAEYEERRSIIVAAESATEAERTELLKRAWADRRAALVALDAQAAEEDAARQRELDQQALEREEAMQANKMARLQGYASAQVEADANRKKEEIAVEFQGNEQISQILQRGVEVQQKTGAAKLKSGLSLAREALAAAGAHSKKLFKITQLAGIAEAIVDTAKGVTKALGTYPPPLNFILAASVGVAGAAQVAAIRAQQPPQAYRLGGVVDSPTYFSARGVPSGVAGEAGPEAILPLRRGAGGRLGVSAPGGGGARMVTVNLNFGDINVDASGAAAPGEVANETTDALEESLVPVIQKTLLDEQRPGGILNPTNAVT